MSFFDAEMPRGADKALLWRYNGRDGVSNHQPHECLLNRPFRCRSKKTSKLHVTGLCAGNSPGTGEFHAQIASDAENVSIWWRHYLKSVFMDDNVPFILRTCNLYHGQRLNDAMSQGICRLGTVLFLREYSDFKPSESNIIFNWQRIRHDYKQSGRSPKVVALFQLQTLVAI